MPACSLFTREYGAIIEAKIQDCTCTHTEKSAVLSINIYEKVKISNNQAMSFSHEESRVYG